MPELHNQPYAPYNRVRNMNNEQLRFLCLRYAQCYRYIHITPDVNGYTNFLRNERIVMEHLRAMMGIAMEPRTDEGQDLLREHYIEIFRLRNGNDRPGQ